MQNRNRSAAVSIDQPQQPPMHQGPSEKAESVRDAAFLVHFWPTRSCCDWCSAHSRGPIKYGMQNRKRSAAVSIDPAQQPPMQQGLSEKAESVRDAAFLVHFWPTRSCCDWCSAHSRGPI